MKNTPTQAPSSHGGHYQPCAIHAVASECMQLLSQGQTITTAYLGARMSHAYGGSDASGAWCWKDAYEALEMALVLFIQQYHAALSILPPARLLTAFARIYALCPTHTKRSEEQIERQQFSTPLTIGTLACAAADIRPRDVVLEPSAGTGMLAVLASLRSRALCLNEFYNERSSLLGQRFPEAYLSHHDAEYINDYLHEDARPDVVLMNPPFSASPSGKGMSNQVSVRHISAALARLNEGGRLVAITGEGFSPYASKWRSAFIMMQRHAVLRASIPLSGSLYYKHGTTMDTRIHVFDKVPADDMQGFVASAPVMESLEEALAFIQGCTSQHPRRAMSSASLEVFRHLPTIASCQAKQGQQPTPAASPSMADNSDVVTALTITKKEAHSMGKASDDEGDSVYLPYHTQTLAIEGAQPHPSPLVESAALASVSPPFVTYRPLLKQHLVTDGVLSEAQLESIIYAGAAHSEMLEGYYKVDSCGTSISSTSQTDVDARQYRRGWYLGDGTGCGKGRQVAGIVMDNWLRGRKRAIWVSKSDKLLEDARRDWVALGGNELDILPQSKFKLGDAITLSEGIIFTTYATLRTSARGKKCSRLEQLTDWLGDRFDGCIMFDESHAMASAIACEGARGIKDASQQGVAGLKLQYALPDARVVYVSATGATTVSNLAYATRLGLWGTPSIPFANQSDFIVAMEQGGIAAMEVIARDLKSMGLYLARSLSYAGVEYAFLHHDLTCEQIAIYDAYAEAFKVIHHHLEDAMQAANITAADGTTQNSTAKSAARAAFESNKQRFFNHLLMSMKCPSLIRSMERDLEEGRSPVIQIVSTNEALMERRLADIPTDQWQDLQLDITPREYVFDYLMHAFPVHLYRVFTDEHGKAVSELARDDEGNPIMCKTALAKRDAMIDKLASLPAINGALDQIMHHFGHECVAECSGRSRRIIKMDEDGMSRYAIQNRPASANTSETHDFMDGKKQILIFSEAGGTGRSYHADRHCINQRRRVHYLLEAGWRADTAVQGLGRTNRTNQSSTPIFRPVATDVKGEKRFLSTIARRLDTLGAMTKGQRETGSQGLFRSEDNLESDYARAALRDVLRDLYYDRLDCCSLHAFEQWTGLELSTQEGMMKEQLPAMAQFLNRVLALPIDLQNNLFEALELRIDARIEAAKEAGTFEVGLEMLRAESFTLSASTLLKEHGDGHASTMCNHIIQRDTMRYPSGDEIVADSRYQDSRKVQHAKSGHVALASFSTRLNIETGAMQTVVELTRPNGRERPLDDEWENGQWVEVDKDAFITAWDAKVAQLPTQRVSEFYLISGVLLPVWKQLAKDNLRVCRLVTDDGTSLLGRVVMPIDIAGVYRSFGVGVPQITLHADDIVTRVRDGRRSAPLGNGLVLRPARIMQKHRLEVVDYDMQQAQHLKPAGCMSEIISYKKRYFVPDNDTAAEVIARLQAIV